MRRKEYAVSLGLATPGKGRMSREALEAIDKARSAGRTFDDDVVNTPAPVKAAQPTVSVKKTDSPPVSMAGATDHVMGIIMRYPIDKEFKVQDSHGKRFTVTARAICHSTGVSLAGCPCNSHTTLLPSMEIVNVN